MRPGGDEVSQDSEAAPVMMNLRFVSQLLKARQADLKQRGVRSLAVFGSVARGEVSDDSDLDLLVEFDRPVGLFEFIRLKYVLQDLTGCRVDLVTPDALRPPVRETILREAVYVV
jgi:predicted nucleotidyltransferase